MNDAYIAEGKRNIITSYRNTKNWGSNTVANLYGFNFAASCRFELRGRSVLGCSGRVTGTGFLVSPDTVKNGWTNVKISEDTAYTADIVLQGKKVIYCDEAVFYDEQPTNVKTMMRQRLRWAKGTYIGLCDKASLLLYNIFRRSKNDEDRPLRFSSFDTLLYMAPMGLMWAALNLTKVIFLSCSPLFGFSAASFGADWLVALLNVILSGYLSMVLKGIVICVAERKRIFNLKWYHKIIAILLWPIFDNIYVPLQFVALVDKKNTTWKPIPHSHAASHEQLNILNKKTAAIITQAAEQPDFTQEGGVL